MWRSIVPVSGRPVARYLRISVFFLKTIYCKCSEQNATVEHALCACRCTEECYNIYNVLFEQKQQWFHMVPHGSTWFQPGGVDTHFWNLPNLVMTNSSPWYRWPIEIDGLPNLRIVMFMAMLNNQMVFFFNDTMQNDDRFFWARTFFRCACGMPWGCL